MGLFVSIHEDAYQSELYSDDPVIRGVAISRYAQGWLCLCKSTQDGDKVAIQSVLKPEAYDAMVKEAKRAITAPRGSRRAFLARTF